MEAKFTDILVTDDDLTLDGARNPEICTDRAVIAQDIVHMIREEGFLPPLVGNRNRGDIERAKVEITIAVDNDYRIVPGSAAIEEPEPGLFYIWCESIEFGKIYTYLGAI